MKREEFVYYAHVDIVSRVIYMTGYEISMKCGLIGFYACL
jgi:hypothetical protein